MTDLCCLIILALPFFIIWRQRKAREQMNSNLRMVADQLKMGFNPDHGFEGTLMRGEIGQFRHRCRLHYLKRRGAKGRYHIYLVTTVSFLKPRSLGLEVTPQGFLAEGITFGGAPTQDIQTGHSDFDSNFRVKGFDEGKVRDFLDAERMESILSLKERLPWYNTMSINDEGVSLRMSGLIDDPNTVAGAIFQLADLATAIEKLS